MAQYKVKNIIYNKFTMSYTVCIRKQYIYNISKYSDVLQYVILDSAVYEKCVMST